MSMFNDIDWTRKEIVFRIQKSHGIREKILAGTQGRFSVLETKRSGMERFLTRLKDNGTLEGFKDKSHPVFKSFGALSRGILKRRTFRDTIHCNADASNTELLFRIIHSVNQLSIYGAVSNRCEQFGLTEEEKGQEKQKESVTKGVLTSVKSQEVKLLVSLQNLHLETACKKTFMTSNHCPRHFDSQRFANSHRSGTGYQLS